MVDHEDDGVEFGRVVADRSHDRGRREGRRAAQHLVQVVLLGRRESEQVEDLRRERPGAVSAEPTGEVGVRVAQPDDHLAVELSAVAHEAVGVHDLGAVGRGEDVERVGHVGVLALAPRDAVGGRRSEAAGDDRAPDGIRIERVGNAAGHEVAVEQHVAAGLRIAHLLRLGREVRPGIPGSDGGHSVAAGRGSAIGAGRGEQREQGDARRTSPPAA